MTDWRDPYRNEAARGARGGREIAPAPWYAREDRNLQRGYGEGEFERGGRPSGGYAQGGSVSHMPSAEGLRGAYEVERYGRYRYGRPVREVMTPHAEVLHPDMTLSEAARRMRADHFGAYPVGERDRLIGMVTDRDIVVRAIAEGRPPGAATVREVMSTGVIYCFDDEDVVDVADLMAERQVRRLPVLNRDKRLVGMVALADLGLTSPEAAQRALAGVSERSGIPRR